MKIEGMAAIRCPPKDLADHRQATALLIGFHQFANMWMVQILTPAMHLMDFQLAAFLDGSPNPAFMMAASVSKRFFWSGSKINTFLMATWGLGGHRGGQCQRNEKDQIKYLL